MSRQVSPILDDDDDPFINFINGPEEYNLQSLGSSLSETPLSPRPRPSSAEEEDVGNLSEDTVQHTKGPPDFISDWSLEIFALACSVASFTALIILLALHDGQPLSVWSLPLSLNTVVSLLSVIVKTPLAFIVGTCLGQEKWARFSKRQGPLSAFVAIEEAGRGPLGSMTLMWKLKFRQLHTRWSCCYGLSLTNWETRHWVCFGAGITIGLLAVDPFFQGLVRYEGEMSSMADSSASIIRSGGLDSVEWHEVSSNFTKLGGQEVTTRCYQTAEVHYGVLMTIQMIMMTPMVFLNSSILRAAQPPGSCVDISDRVTKGSRVDEEGCRRTRHWLLYGREQNRLNLTGGEGYANDSYVCGGYKKPSIADLGVSSWPNDTFSFKKSETLLASFAVLHTQEEYKSNQIPWEETQVYATECALRYCIQAYRPVMRGNKLDEEEIPVSFERVPGSWLPEETNPAGFEAIQDAFGNALTQPSLLTCDRIPRSDLQLRLSGEYHGLPSDIQRTFNISQMSMAGIESMIVNSHTPPYVNHALIGSTNITATFNRAALLLSYQIRDIDGTIVQGDTEQWVVYIRVRWRLIAGPAVLLLAAVVFSARVVIESRGIRLETFKSEPLEMLLYGFDAKSRDYLRASHRAGQDVEEKMIQLEKADEGPELRLKEGRE